MYYVPGSWLLVRTYFLVSTTFKPSIMTTTNSHWSPRYVDPSQPCVGSSRLRYGSWDPQSAAQSQSSIISVLRRYMRTTRHGTPKREFLTDTGRCQTVHYNTSSRSSICFINDTQQLDLALSSALSIKQSCVMKREVPL